LGLSESTETLGETDSRDCSKSRKGMTKILFVGRMDLVGTQNCVVSPLTEGHGPLVSGLGRFGSLPWGGEK
jgi:hypothetical protein